MLAWRLSERARRFRCNNTFSENVVSGNFGGYVPDQDVTIVGSNNTIIGNVVKENMKVVGSNNVVEDNVLDAGAFRARPYPSDTRADMCGSADYFASLWLSGSDNVVVDNDLVRSQKCLRNF